MSTKKPERLIVSFQLTPKELEVVKNIMDASGALKSIAVRGLFRLGVDAQKRKKIGTLEVIRIGSYE